MIDLIKKMFAASAQPDAATEQTDKTRNIRIATCALFVALAQSDDEFSGVEYEHIISILKKEYDLADEHAEELLEISNETLKGSIDLWQFTNLMNQNISKQEKIRVVEMIWRIVYADGHLDDHERLLVRKLSKMLRVTEREMIDAKLRVLHGGEGSA